MKLDKRTTTVILLGVLLAFSSWWFFARPAGDKLESVKAERAAVENQISELQSQQQNLAQGIDPLEGYYRGLSYADSLFPQADAVRETRLAAALSASAAQRGMKDPSFDVQPSAPSGTDGLSVVPVAVAATGSYSNVLAWIDDLRDDEGLRSVEGVTLAAGEGGNYQVSFTLKVWFSTTPPLSIPAQGATATAPAQPVPATTPAG